MMLHTHMIALRAASRHDYKRSARSLIGRDVMCIVAASFVVVFNAPSFPRVSFQ